MSARRLGLAIVLLALAVRCAALLALGLAAPPPAWGDDADYDAIARGLVAAHVYGSTWFPPGYPFLMALIYLAAGHSVAAVRLVQAVLSAATCGVAHAIGRASFGSAAGAAAALLMALHPGLIYMSWRLMAETACILLLALAVWWGGRAAAAGSAWWAAAAGAALGAAMLCKLNLLLAVPLLLAWPAWAMAGHGGRRLAVAAAGAAGCAALLLLLPLANRLSSAGAAEPLPSNGGETLWWSNNPLADGYFVDPDGTAAGRAFIARHGLAASALAARDPFVRSHADRQLAMAWVRENPGAFLRLAGRKLWNAFGPAPRSELLAQHPAAAWLYAALTVALVPLCLGGMWWTRGALPAAMPLYLLLGGAVAMTVVFYGSPRFTLQVMPFLLLFAGVAAAHLLPSLALHREAA